MSYTKIWLHCVWTTKNRQPWMIKPFREKILHHIKENAIEKDIYIDSINGYLEHIHCLISLKRDQNIAECLQLIKGESSFWINNNKLLNNKFYWQDDYFAVSVGQSQLNKLRTYISNQEEHHQKRSFADEYKEFMQKYGFE
ncbi:MAG: IS200/IS605 family transposase [Bacteroidales bacterium]